LRFLDVHFLRFEVNRFDFIEVSLASQGMYQVIAPYVALCFRQYRKLHHLGEDPLGRLHEARLHQGQREDVLLAFNLGQVIPGRFQ
jgi:hypothetical protein